MTTTSILTAALLVLGGCGGTDLADAPDAARGADAGQATDAAVSTVWQLERIADGRAVHAFARRFDGLLFAAGADELACARTSAGDWLPLDPESLTSALAPLATPRGTFYAALFDHDGGLVLAGELASHRGGMVKHAVGGSPPGVEGWHVAFDEVVDTSPGGGAGPLVAAVRWNRNCKCISPIVGSWGGLAVADFFNVTPWSLFGGGELRSALALAPTHYQLFGVGDGVWKLTDDNQPSWQSYRASPRILRAAATDPDPTKLGGVAVGDDGLVYDFASDTFATVTSHDLTAVAWRDVDDVWAVGLRGAIEHRDATGWHELVGPAGTPDFTAVVADGSVVWIASSRGEIWRLDR